MEITDELSRDYSKFMNFLMAEVCNAFFQKKFPKVLPEMKEMLQFSPERRIGDRFLSEYDTMIRLYGFVNQPYILPASLTIRVFALELIRKRLIVENEHFLNFRKTLEIKFPWIVGPFVIKNNDALPIIESLLREMGFSVEAAINYDPPHVISNRRQANKKNHLNILRCHYFLKQRTGLITLRI